MALCCLRRHRGGWPFDNYAAPGQFGRIDPGSLLRGHRDCVGDPPLALTSEYLSAGAVAGGLALISSLGNLGPALSPSINGFILRSTGDNIYSMYFVMALYLLSGTLLLLMIRPAPAAAGAPVAVPAH